jgi:hypothetical protein
MTKLDGIVNNHIGNTTRWLHVKNCISPGHTPKMTVEMLVVQFLTPAGTCPGSSPCKPAQIHVQHRKGNQVVCSCVAWHGEKVAAWCCAAGLHAGCHAAAVALLWG